MKYGILVFIIVFSLILNMGGIQAAQSSGTSEDKAFTQAKLLLDSILNGESFVKSQEGQVTRGDFMVFIVKALNRDCISPDRFSYKDVPEDYPAAAEIYTALTQNWIEPGENFRPDIPITYGEGIKICVKALGYDFVAISQGGYPNGFIAVANQIGLLKKIPVELDKPMDIRNGYVLGYNVLNAEILRKTTYGKEESFEVDKGSSVLNERHDIYKASGIISSTPYNSLGGDEEEELDSRIGINGSLYVYPKADPGILGMNCTVYYREEDGQQRVVCLIPEENEEVFLKPKGIKEITNNSISYALDTMDKVKTYKLDMSYTLIYNGKKISQRDARYFQFTSGRIRLLDNDGNGVYDLIFAEDYKYITISAVDALNRILYDDKGVQYKVDLSDEDCRYTIYDPKAKQFLRLWDLKTGDLLAVKSAEDHKLIELVLCKDYTAGSLTGLDPDQKKIYIDDKEYDLSDYFSENYLNGVTIGNKIKIALGIDQDVVSFGDDEYGFKYGYLVGLEKKNGLADTYRMKLFTQSGEMKTFEVDKKITLDGESTKVNQTVMTGKFMSGQQVQGQLLRYSVNNEGKIHKLDTGAVDTAVDYGKSKPYENSLTKYAVSSGWYKYSLALFAPYFNIQGSFVFLIPVNTSDEEFFEMGNTGSFDSDVSYSVTAYDIDKSGSAKAMVYVRDVRGSSVRTSATGFVVENVSKFMDADGKLGTKVSGWSNNRFSAYFLPGDVTVQKSSGKPLGSGDIIRFNLDKNNSVTNIIVDFDANPEVFAPNTSAGSATFNGTNATVMYQEGKVYSCDKGYVLMSSVKNAAGKYDYSITNLRNFPIHNKIVLFNRKNRTLRPAAATDIKTYLSAGDEASYVVIQQNGFNDNLVVIYE